MPDPKPTGRGGPGRNQGRRKNADKGLPPGRTANIAIKVEDDLRDYWIALPITQKRALSETFLAALRRAYIESLVV